MYCFIIVSIPEIKFKKGKCILNLFNIIATYKNELFIKLFAYN